MNYLRVLNLCSVALIAIFMAKSSHAFPATLNLCEITETRMLAGMNGANVADLQMSVTINNIQNSRATVSLTSANQTVLSTGIRGLLLWATDANGARVGNWTVREGQQLFSPVSNCNGGAVSHSGVGQKLFNSDSPTAPQGFQLNIPSGTVAPVSVRAVAVYTHFVWQIVSPIVAQGLGGNSTSVNTGSSSSAVPAYRAITGAVQGTPGMIAAAVAVVSLFFAF